MATSRTTLGAGDDKAQAVNAVNALLATELTNPTAFAAMAAAPRLDLIRRALVLLLRVTLKRMLK